MSNASEHPLPLAQRAAGSLRSGRPEFELVWDALRAARREATDLGPLIDALAQPAAWTLDTDERARLYRLLTEDTSVIGNPRDMEPVTIHEWPDASTDPDLLRQEIGQIARDAVDQQDQFRNRVIDPKNRYFAFSPAWEVETVLPKVFAAAADPAVVIGEHLKTLFDVQRLVDEDAGIFLAASSRTPEVSTVLTRLVSIARRASDLTRPEQITLSFLEQVRNEEWNPTGIERASQLLALVGGALQTDQHLFVALMNTLAAACVDFKAARDLSDDARGLADALYPVTIWMLMAFSVPGLPPENLRWSLDGSESTDRPPELAAAIASLQTLIQRLAEQDARPFLPPQLLPHLLQLHGVFEAMTEDHYDVFMAHIRFGVHYRRDTLRGYAQYELNWGYLLQSALEYHRREGTRKDDLTYRLGQVWLDYTGADNAVDTSLPIWLGREEYSTPTAERARAREYALLQRSAVREGFLTLADAIGAFFLFSQSLRYAGRLEGWKDVHEIITTASSLPDSQHTRTALSFAHGMAKHYGEQLLVLRLANRAPSNENYEVVAGNLPGIGFAQREAVANDVIELIGQERRAKLSARGFDLLVAAHYKLSKLQQELIFGVLGDWGGIAADFARVFEIELSEGFSATIRSEEYRRFKQARGEGRFLSTRPTLGSFLHLLREYADLPALVQQRLETLSELHNSSALLDRLEQIVKEHRNPAAHASSYDGPKLQTLLGLLYKERVLLEFIDALKSRPRP